MELPISVKDIGTEGGGQDYFVTYSEKSQGYLLLGSLLKLIRVKT